MGNKITPSLRELSRDGKEEEEEERKAKLSEGISSMSTISGRDSVSGGNFPPDEQKLELYRNTIRENPLSIGRIFVFLKSSNKEEEEEQDMMLEQIWRWIRHFGMRPYTIIISQGSVNRPYLFEIMKRKTNGELSTPQIFFNEKYIGNFEEFDRMKDDKEYFSKLIDECWNNSPGELYKVWVNQQHLFNFSPSRLFFPKFDKNFRVGCVLRLENLTNITGLFQIMTNKAEKYSINPKIGYVPPLKFISVKFTLEPGNCFDESDQFMAVTTGFENSEVILSNRYIELCLSEVKKKDERNVKRICIKTILSDEEGNKEYEIIKDSKSILLFGKNNIPTNINSPIEENLNIPSDSHFDMDVILWSHYSADLKCEISMIEESLFPESILSKSYIQNSNSEKDSEVFLYSICACKDTEIPGYDEKNNEEFFLMKMTPNLKKWEKLVVWDSMTGLTHFTVYWKENVFVGYYNFSEPLKFKKFNVSTKHVEDIEFVNSKDRNIKLPSLTSFSHVILNNEVFLIHGIFEDKEISKFVKSENYYVLNLETMEFGEFREIGNLPPARINPTSCIINSCIYLFGGSCYLSDYNDTISEFEDSTNSSDSEDEREFEELDYESLRRVFRFDISSKTWSYFGTSGEYPCSFENHFCCSYRNRFLVVFGGERYEYEYELESKRFGNPNFYVLDTTEKHKHWTKYKLFDDHLKHLKIVFTNQIGIVSEKENKIHVVGGISTFESSKDKNKTNRTRLSCDIFLTIEFPPSQFPDSSPVLFLREYNEREIEKDSFRKTTIKALSKYPILEYEEIPIPHDFSIFPECRIGASIIGSLNGRFFFLAGGSNNLENKKGFQEVWVFDKQEKKFEKFADLPDKISIINTFFYGGKFFVMPILDEIPIFSIHYYDETYGFKELTVTRDHSEKRPPSLGFSTVVYGEWLYVFHGYDLKEVHLDRKRKKEEFSQVFDPNSLRNCLYLVNLISGDIYHIQNSKQKGDIPSPRMYPKVCRIQNKIYFFGGENIEQFIHSEENTIYDHKTNTVRMKKDIILEFQQLFVLEITEEFVWSKVKIYGYVKLPLGIGQLLLSYKDQYLIHYGGGMTTKFGELISQEDLHFSSAFVYILNTKSKNLCWKKYELFNNTVATRFVAKDFIGYHYSLLFPAGHVCDKSDKMYIFGGNLKYNDKEAEGECCVCHSENIFFRINLAEELLSKEENDL